jgi:hypothetical protein
MKNVFAIIQEIAGDLANDTSNPVIAVYGVAADVLATTIQGLIGLASKKNAAATAPAPGQTMQPAPAATTTQTVAQQQAQQQQKAV